MSAQLAGTQTVGFDTEFLRERTYHPALCLAQIALNGEFFLVDPLSDIDCGEFWKALVQTELTLHSGRQDLEVMLEDSESLPEKIYDTQIAAGLVGLPPQIGYAALVEKFCSVQLAKAHTRTNWSRRPLPAEVLEYATDDVRYLAEIRDELDRRADALGRREWIEQDCNDLLDPERYVVDPEEAWHRLRGIRRLPQRVQQRAMALAAWREAQALSRNLPRQWVIKDEALINLSYQNPEKLSDFEGIQGLDARSAQRHGKAILAALQGELPGPPVHVERPDHETRALQKLMAGKVRELSEELELESEVLAPQRELRLAANGIHDIRALRGWRKPLLEPLLAPLMPA